MADCSISASAPFGRTLAFLRVFDLSSAAQVCRGLPLPSTLLQNAGLDLHQLLLLNNLVEVLKLSEARCTRLGGGNRQQICQRELLLLDREGLARPGAGRWPEQSAWLEDLPGSWSGCNSIHGGELRSLGSELSRGGGQIRS